MKCTILDDYQKVANTIVDWSLLDSSIQIQVFHQQFPTEAALVKALKNQEILVIMRERTMFNAAVLSQLPNLKLLITTGMRNAAIDLAYANARGITVCGTNTLATPPTELTWALLLCLARHIIQETHSVHRNGPWQNTLGIGLSGKQLGIIGLGKIGSQVARIGKAFGMNVIAWSQNLTKARTDIEGIQLAPSKESLLESSDFVTIHLVLSERTRNLICAADIARMRSTAYLINTSRAPIINESDLIQALKEKRIAGVGIDVFETEPLPAEHPLRILPNVLATPHIGYVTEENYKIYFNEAIEDINAFLKKSPIRELTAGKGALSY